MQTQKIDFIGLYLAEVEAIIIDNGYPRFMASQLWDWVYRKGCFDLELMTNIKKEKKRLLADLFNINTPCLVSKELISFDETIKWLLKFRYNDEIETVFIPEAERGTLCISSQVGCTLTCSFCHTGTQKLVRNLTAAEIIAQFMHAKHSLSDFPADKHEKRLTNIVMMGMGEPLLNYDNVAKALKIIMDPKGLMVSRRKITLSTSGIVPMIVKCGEELGINLAISLHAVHDELRNELVPINKRYPINDLLDACRKYPTKDRITFEYVMLDGVNDSMADAKELVRLIRGIPAKINLIPFNPWPGSHYKCSSEKAIRGFASVIEDAGYMSPVRRPRGQDILAACGQLKSETIKERASTLSRI